MRHYTGGFALRVVTAGNTQVRRLGYISAISQILPSSTPNSDSVIKNLLDWARQHQEQLDQYTKQYDGQGAINPGYPSGAKRYIDMADGLQLVARTGRRIELSRFGELLRILSSIEPSANPFCLSHAEILFYTYWLLLYDADFLLLVMDAASEVKGIKLADLQAQFQHRFIERLEAKRALVSDTSVRSEIGDVVRRAREAWRVPARYAEHIVPTRAGWLLDLGFLEPKLFRKQQYALSTQGKYLWESLLKIPANKLSDITGDWLWSNGFSSVQKSLKRNYNETPWNTLQPQEMRTILDEPMREACQLFHLFGMKACSLLPALIYCAVVLAVRKNIQVNLADIVSWESQWGRSENFEYRFHISPSEENSYVEIIG